ncbi:hypothetical protein [Natrinema pallidum]|uniref:hypothetical protein n=1 Tax=Natrinema pallidum TaxID=69527 RepID=UPI0037508516
MGVKTYKAIKATAQLAGIVAMVHAMNLGMDPGTAGTIIGAILLGPEYLEAKLVGSEDGTNDPN